MGGTQPAVHVGKVDTLGELCWDSVNWPSKLHPSSCKLPIYIMCYECMYVCMYVCTCTQPRVIMIQI